MEQQGWTIWVTPALWTLVFSVSATPAFWHCTLQGKCISMSSIGTWKWNTVYNICKQLCLILLKTIIFWRLFEISISTYVNINLLKYKTWDWDRQLWLMFCCVLCLLCLVFLSCLLFVCLVTVIVTTNIGNFFTFNQIANRIKY